jgi:hypothetical protein
LLLGNLNSQVHFKGFYGLRTRVLTLGIGVMEYESGGKKEVKKQKIKLLPISIFPMDHP